MALDISALGMRIAQGRTEAGLTQAELASLAGLDRSALAKIETGGRGVSALELASIAAVLGQRIEWFLTRDIPAIASHRIRRGSDSTVASIDRELERLASDVEFLTSLGALGLQPRDAWQAPSSGAATEAMAERVRSELGLASDAAALNLPELFSELGLLVFASELGPQAADAGTVLMERGGVSIVNSSSRLGRRRISAAHELAHFLVADEYTVDWRTAENTGSEHLEALFDRFARAMLLPSTGLRTYWATVIGDGLHAAAVRTANHFRVDMSTLARRLVETGVENQRTANSVRPMRTTQADILDYDLLVPLELENGTLPRLYERAVLGLYRAERLSPDRALDLLRGKYAPEDLPDLPATREDEMWAITS